MFLVVLDDGLGGGVVNVELFSHVDDRPPILDTPYQLRSCLLSNLLIVFGGFTQGHEDRFKLITDYLNG